MFKSELLSPVLITARSEITMEYRENGVKLDLSSAGRGLQQTLLLLAYMYANPGAVLLLDEPDAHLEILRQREIYHLLTDAARESGSQIIAASHSEVLLNEAAGRDMVIAFVGRPHRINDRGSQLLKALKDIGIRPVLPGRTDRLGALPGGFDGSVDTASLCQAIGTQEAIRALERPFVHYVGNQPTKVQNHYHGLREACPALLGVALFDRLDSGQRDIAPVEHLIWERREIENYICSRATLEAYAMAKAWDAAPGPLFTGNAMREAIEEIETALITLEKGSPWSADIKASDDFLDPLFIAYFKKLGLPNLMAKKNFYELAEYVPNNEIDPEIREKLDAIAGVAESATPECE